MTAQHEQQLADRYMTDLEEALSPIDSQRREELLADVRAHLAESIAEGDEVEDVLRRLGDPLLVAHAAIEEHGPARGPEPWLPALTITALLVGGLVVPVVGWLAGVALLWSSGRWTFREKLLGTLVVPGGLLPATYLALNPLTDTQCTVTQSVPPAALDAPAEVFVNSVCESPTTGATLALTIALVLVLVLAPVLAAVRLVRAARGGGTSAGTRRGEPMRHAA